MSDHRAEFFMADIRRKRPTARRAVATGFIDVGPEAFARIRDRSLPKGDALAMAEIGGLNGARHAGDLMPLCHPLPLELVRTEFALHPDSHSIQAWCEVATTARTGVEMEALAAVNAALLTVYDLTKPVEPALTLRAIRLLFKEGGKKGLWLHPDGMSDAERERFKPQDNPGLDGARAATITLSDRAAAGVYADRSGPLLARCLDEMGAVVEETVLIADEADALRSEIQRLADAGIDLVITTGGTGPGPRDHTPDTLRQCFDRELPGISEMMRAESAHHTPLSWLSNGVAGLVGSTLVIALPGSSAAVRETMVILEPLLPHLLRTIAGQGCETQPGGCHAQDG